MRSAVQTHSSDTKSPDMQGPVRLRSLDFLANPQDLPLLPNEQVLAVEFKTVKVARKPYQVIGLTTLGRAVPILEFANFDAYVRFCESLVEQGFDLYVCAGGAK